MSLSTFKEITTIRHIMQLVDKNLTICIRFQFGNYHFEGSLVVGSRSQDLTGSP